MCGRVLIFHVVTHASYSASGSLQLSLSRAIASASFPARERQKLRIDCLPARVQLNLILASSIGSSCRRSLVPGNPSDQPRDLRTRSRRGAVKRAEWLARPKVSFRALERPARAEVHRATLSEAEGFWRVVLSRAAACVMVRRSPVTLTTAG